jgi:predicted ATP-dependent endonuclease of OLD family
MIKKIETTYKNLDLTIEDLAEINYFVGKNGSGKTRLMDAVNTKFNKKKEIGVETKLISYEENLLENCFHFRLNNQTEIDNLMAKDEKSYNITDKNNPYNKRRIKLGLSDEFKTHEITKMIIELFFGKNNLVIGIGYLRQGEFQGESYIQFFESGEYKFCLEECSSGFQSLFKTWNNIYHQNFKGKVDFTEKSIFYLLCFDEGDRHLHPSLAKLLPEKLELIRNGIVDFFIELGSIPDRTVVQIFVSTHSPFLIRGALKHENHKIFHLENGSLKKSFDKHKLIAQSGLPFDNVLRDLGFEMKDIYYPNCLIYVEGPVDVLFVSYWLELFFIENGFTNNHFIKGVDYDFVEFGGSLAAHLSFKFNSQTKNDYVLETTELVNIFSLNRKVFVMVDNDTNKKAFQKTKERLKNKIDELNNGSIFYRNSKYSTIESLLTKSTKRSKRKEDKLGAAIVNLKFWRKNKLGFDKFNPEAKILSKQIFDFITNSN